MRAPFFTGSSVVVLLGLSLSACATRGAESGSSSETVAASSATVGRPILTSMSDQYARPHPGPVAAAGAGAWVPPAPAPVFVATGPMPPANPEPPPPAAVANRQPSTPAARPAPDASAISRPEAAAPAAAPPTAARNSAVRTTGLALFSNYSCGACHMFADAGATGAVGPSLDRHLAVPLIVSTVTEGRGAMPAFGGQMSDAEIATLANYISQYSK
jgi:mono/diheme cytochrome c family protein